MRICLKIEGVAIREVILEVFKIMTFNYFEYYLDG